MGVVRVQQAKAAGADVIVTACPFCLTNIEDAIKVARLEGRMQALDLVELVDGQLQNWSHEELNLEILVYVKRVPDSAENEISVGPGGAHIARDDRVYCVNGREIEGASRRELISRQ